MLEGCRLKVNNPSSYVGDVRVFDSAALEGTSQAPSQTRLYIRENKNSKSFPDILSLLVLILDRPSSRILDLVPVCSSYSPYFYDNNLFYSISHIRFFCLRLIYLSS
jgi:hypothetical protein